MIAAGLPAARPIPFPHDGSPTEGIKWLQREAEHTTALAERSGNLSVKMKALHEIERLIWLEGRLNQQAADDHVDDLYQEHLDRMAQQAKARFEEGRAQKEAALANAPQGSTSPWERYKRSCSSDTSERERG
jgi:hypothetical protein